MGKLTSQVARAGLESNLQKIADLIEKSGMDLDELARFNKVKLYQGFYKDAEGEAHTVDMTSLEVIPMWADGPEWPVIQQAKPMIVRPPKPTARKIDDGWKRCVILPDTQIGYRRDAVTGELDPFHDEAAMSVALQIVREVKPHLIINLGDVMDLAEWGTYEQEAGFVFTTQATVDRAHRWLAEQVAAAGDQLEEVRLIEGNHDRRLERAIRRNAMAAFGLKRANEPASWPVMSVPHLLRLEELGVTYVGGYPAGITWINQNLACIHGQKVRSAGSTAAAVIDDERVSVIFGHVHRIELQHKTRRVWGGRKQSFSATPGCLCRIDGAVPSVKSSTDPMGRPIATAENWQQAVAVVEYEPDDGRYSLNTVPIIEGWARFNGKEFSA